MRTVEPGEECTLAEISEFDDGLALLVSGEAEG